MKTLRLAWFQGLQQEGVSYALSGRSSLRVAQRFVLIGAALLVLGTSGCAVDGDYGWNPNVTVGVGVDYYEPFGYDYGGWSPGYQVGPPRLGIPRGGRGPDRAYRPPPPGRQMPSIPSGPRRRDDRPNGEGRR